MAQRPNRHNINLDKLRFKGFKVGDKVTAKSDTYTTGTVVELRLDPWHNAECKVSVSKDDEGNWWPADMLQLK